MQDISWVRRRAMDADDGNRAADGQASRKISRATICAGVALMTGVALGAHAALAQSSGGAGGSFGISPGGAGGGGIGAPGVPGALSTDGGGGGGAGAIGGASGSGAAGGGAGTNGPTPTNGGVGTNAVSTGEGAGGGGGGGSVFVNVFDVTLSGGSVSAGRGGNGGFAIGAGSGGGGSGGYGLYSNGLTHDAIEGAAALRGGDGGTGGEISSGGAGTTVRSGSGGDGGTGAAYLAAGSSITITSGMIAGGNGGAGGRVLGAAGGSFVVGGTGGAGGVGILGAGLMISNSASGSIVGGNGGRGGNGGGTGGAGGVAVSGANLTLSNAGTITGGNGGAAGPGTPSGDAGAGGAGIYGANLDITNSGTIQGGLADAGMGGRADAITFTGGANKLTLAPSSTIIGNISFAGTLELTSTGTATLSSAITGAGSVTKTGASALTLSGASTYTGDTTVSAGTLALTGSITSNVTNNATFTNAGTVTGNLTNTVGTATNTGIITGSATINGGLFSNDGTVVGAAVVNNGGTFGGNGTVGGLIVNAGGVLAPGNSIGGVNIAGNLLLGPGAVYRVEVSPNDADRTNVTGTAQLGGTLQLVFQPGPYAARNHTILSAADGRSGTFDSVTIENQPTALKADVTYTTTGVTLVTLISQIHGVAGLTPNQRAVAVVQDAAFNGGLPMINALFGVAGAQLNHALDQLSGEVHASTVGTLANDSLAMRGAILGRLRQASYGGGEMASMAALSLGGPQTAFADGAMESALAYAKSPIVTKAPMAAPRPTDTVFWAQGFGAWGRVDGDGNATSVKRDLAGFITGVDTRVGGNGRLGIAAGYTGTKASSLGTASVETAHIAGYGGWKFGAINLRAGGAYAFHSIDTDRVVDFAGFADRLTSRTDGSTWQVFGELGYGLALGNIAFEPFAGTAWLGVSTNGAAERGGLAALNVAAQSFETGYSTLGVRAASIVPLANDMILIPRATVAWQHTFNDVTPAATLAFQVVPANAFTISGTPIARNSLLAEAGLDLAISRDITVGVSYVGQVGSAVTDHAAKGKFSWTF